MPLGCLGFLALIFVFVGAIVTLVFGVMKSSDVYKAAVEEAKNHPAVIEALGSPVREGLFVSGSTNTSGSGGDADLAIPLNGRKGKATLYVVAKKTAGKWNYSVLTVKIHQTKQRISLLHEDARL